MVLKKWPYHDVLRPPICKTWKFQVQKAHHAPPRAARVAAMTKTRLQIPHAPTRAGASFARDTRGHVPYLTRDSAGLTSPMTSSADPLVQIRPGPTRIRTGLNYKKKKKNQKSKITKRTCPTQFFEYIPILGPIYSFEARKLCKRPVSKKLTFVQMLTKCQNF